MAKSRLCQRTPPEGDLIWLEVHRTTQLHLALCMIQSGLAICMFPGPAFSSLGGNHVFLMGAVMSVKQA